MMGMMTSPTSELTMVPKAAPMITPTARSMTLPRMANFLKSSSIARSPGIVATRTPSVYHRSRGRNTCGAAGPASQIVGPGGRLLVDQSRMHHGVADRRLRLVRQRDHGQPHGIGALAEHRKRVFGRRR